MVVAQGRRFVLAAMDDFTARLLDHQSLDDSDSPRGPGRADSPAGGGAVGTDGGAAGDSGVVLARLRERVAVGEARRRLWAGLRARDPEGGGRVSVEEVMEALGERLYGIRDRDLFAFVDAFRSHDRSAAATPALSSRPPSLLSLPLPLPLPRSPSPSPSSSLSLSLSLSRSPSRPPPLSPDKRVRDAAKGTRRLTEASREVAPGRVGKCRGHFLNPKP